MRITIFILVTYILIFFAGQNTLFGDDFTSSNLPIIIIDTHGQDIPYDDPRIIADMGIIYNGTGIRNVVTDSFNDYDGKISIEIRGSSSAGWKKKSYGLETQNSDGSNNNVSLLDMPEENDWVLYAPYYDRSLMRNALTYRLMRQLGWYASRTRFCELILNGTYQGVYVLMEKIKRDKNRVDIAKLKPGEISGDDLTGGYIFKIDKEPEKPGFDSPYPAFEGASHPIRYQYHYPKADEIVVQQEEYLKNFVLLYETAMAGSNISDPQAGYPKYIDVNSFIDYLIMNELSRNVDGYRLSAYFNKDKESNGGKIKAGPVWDYNFSFGNAGYYDSWLLEGWQVDFFAEDRDFHSGDPFLMPFWWKKLFDDPDFQEQLAKRWWQLRANTLSLSNIYTHIELMQDTLNESQERNFEIWVGPGEPHQGDGWFPPDFPIASNETWGEELEYLKKWIADRVQWIDGQLPDLNSISNALSGRQAKQHTLDQNYPNPFNPSTKIKYHLSTTGHVELQIFTILGQRITTLVSEKKAAGFHTIQWNAEHLSDAIYLYRLTIDNTIIDTKKMIFLK